MAVVRGDIDTQFPPKDRKRRTRSESGAARISSGPIHSTPSARAVPRSQAATAGTTSPATILSTDSPAPTSTVNSTTGMPRDEPHAHVNAPIDEPDEGQSVESFTAIARQLSHDADHDSDDALSERGLPDVNGPPAAFSEAAVPLVTGDLRGRERFLLCNLFVKPSDTEFAFFTQYCAMIWKHAEDSLNLESEFHEEFTSEARAAGQGD